MKILLTTLNSKFVHSNLAIKYLYTLVADEYSNVDVREFTINNDPNHVYMEIAGANYDMVCFSSYIWNIEQIKELCQNLKLAKPGIQILLGGPEVSYDAPKFAQENPWVDYIIAGEGEYPFYRFIEVLHSDMAFETVPGLVYRADGKIYVNSIVDPIDFNMVPFPYRILDVEEDRVVYYESSRGCPFRCSYCLSSIDKNVRALSMGRVKSELAYFLKKKVPQVKLIDRTFNYDKKRAYEIIRYLVENDNGVTAFHLEICADLLDGMTIRLLSKARKGQFELEMGIQSTNPETLFEINRNHDVEPVLNNIKKLTAAGNLHTHVDLIAGLPGETYEMFGRSFNDVYELGADALQLGFLKVLKGTAIEDRAEQYGIKYRSKAPYEVISTDSISAEELIKLHRIENVLDIYYNRGGFESTMRFLVERFEKGFDKRGAFGLYEALADYYYSSGFQNKSHSKDDNYRILYAFIKSLEEEAMLSDTQRSVGKWSEVEGYKAVLLLDSDAESSMDELNYKRFIKKSWKI